MTKTNPGKRFEEKFRRSVEELGERHFVMRVPDKLVPVGGGRTISKPTEADFVVACRAGTFLVECKATSKKSLEFGKVEEHQERALSAFDAYPRSHGLLAVEFYDQTSYRTARRMFLLRISDWLAYKESSGRKSMPIKAFEEMGSEAERSGALYIIDFEGAVS